MAPEIGAKTSLTDADGRYEFRDLPAGRFTVNASKSGYVMVQYGQSRPFESGRPIELAEKQVHEVMVPRIDIKALPVSATLAEIIGRSARWLPR